jgi:hypothetical protein
MQGNNSADRRIFARIPTKLSIRFLASGKNEECRGQTVDISANGVGFVSEAELSPLTPLELWLELPDNRGPFYTRGEVIWSSPSSKPGRQRTGIRLEKAELMGLAPLLWR